VKKLSRVRALKVSCLGAEGLKSIVRLEFWNFSHESSSLCLILSLFKRASMASAQLYAHPMFSTRIGINYSETLSLVKSSGALASSLMVKSDKSLALPGF